MGGVLEDGQRVDQLQVIRQLARGGMGEVYLARDVDLGRKVALKLVRRERLEDRALQRFREEARITARFNHPNIVTVYGFGEHQGHPYVVLEFLEGPTLRERLIEQGRMPPFAAARIVLGLAQALAEAHRHGIVHRDLKPENVLLPPDGRPRVVDFGLAGAASDGEDFAGTPLYMAPEQWLAGAVTAAVDVWALGAILFELTMGRRPFEGTTPALLQLQICDPGRAPPANLPGAEDVAAVIADCLEKNPARRPAAAEVAARLERVLDQRLSQAPRGEVPYRGLLSFSEEDAARFFGRDSELGHAQEHLRGHPVLVVAGPSGAGKTSFVRAGLLPRLRESGAWRVIAVRPGTDPFRALAARLAGISAARTALETTRPLPPGATPEAVPSAPVATEQLAAALRESPARLALVLATVASANRERILLFVDQLEELATQADSAQTRAAFLEAILHAADDPDGPVRVAVTVRDDFLATLDREARGGLLSARVMILTTPAAPAREEILTRPLDGTGFTFEDPALVAEMVRAVEGSPGALPLLSFTAAELWERRDRHARTLTRSAYLQVGGVVGALADHADRTVTTLGSERLETARELLLHLVGADGTRRTVSRSWLLRALPAGAEAVLAHLIERRLVVSSGGDGENDTLEIVHEALIARWKRLQQWVEDRSEGRGKLEEVSRAAQRWRQGGRRDEDLWDGLRLQVARETLARTRLPIPPLARKFVRVGLARAARRVQLEELRREQKSIAVAFLWLALITGVAIFVDGLLRSIGTGSIEVRGFGIAVVACLLVLCYRVERARAWIWYCIPFLFLPLMILEAVNFWEHTATPAAAAAAALDSRVFLLLLLIGATFSLRVPVIALTGAAAAVSLSVARWLVVGPDVGYAISTHLLLGAGGLGLATVVRRIGIILAGSRAPHLDASTAVNAGVVQPLSVSPSTPPAVRARVG